MQPMARKKRTFELLNVALLLFKTRVLFTGLSIQLKICSQPRQGDG